MDVAEIKVDIGPVETKVPTSKGSKSKGSKPKAVVDIEVPDIEVPAVEVPSSKGSKSKKSASPSKSKKSTSASAVRRFTQKRARKTIGKFMKETGSKRKSEFLKVICSDSGVCIAFGKERKKIFDFFKGFTQFDYLSGIKTIGASTNGFVKELEYKHKDYVAHAVLKSSQSKSADNLMYEYFVGLKVNDMATQLPCFVETYGHYEYKTDADRKTFKMEKSGLKDVVDSIHEETKIPKKIKKAFSV